MALSRMQAGRQKDGDTFVNLIIQTTSLTLLVLGGVLDVFVWVYVPWIFRRCRTAPSSDYVIFEEIERAVQKGRGG